MRVPIPVRLSLRLNQVVVLAAGISLRFHVLPLRHAQARPLFKIHDHVQILEYVNRCIVGGNLAFGCNFTVVKYRDESEVQAQK